MGVYYIVSLFGSNAIKYNKDLPPHLVPRFLTIECATIGKNDSIKDLAKALHVPALEA